MKVTKITLFLLTALGWLASAATAAVLGLWGVATTGALILSFILGMDYGNPQGRTLNAWAVEQISQTSLFHVALFGVSVLCTWVCWNALPFALKGLRHSP